MNHFTEQNQRVPWIPVVLHPYRSTHVHGFIKDHNLLIIFINNILIFLLTFLRL